MAIKKAPIIAGEQVNIYCDKCDRIMKFDRCLMNYDDRIVKYVYKCECGHEEISTQQYPHQILHFDLDKLEVVE